MTTPTISPTQTLEQAMLVMQQMPVNKQQEIFDFIDFIAFREKKAIIFTIQ